MKKIVCEILFVLLGVMSMYSQKLVHILDVTDGCKSEYFNQVAFRHNQSVICNTILKALGKDFSTKYLLNPEFNNSSVTQLILMDLNTDGSLKLFLIRLSGREKPNKMEYDKWRKDSLEIVRAFQSTTMTYPNDIYEISCSICYYDSIDYKGFLSEVIRDNQENYGLTKYGIFGLPFLDFFIFDSCQNGNDIDIYDRAIDFFNKRIESSDSYLKKRELEYPTYLVPLSRFGEKIE